MFLLFIFHKNDIFYKVYLYFVFSYVIVITQDTSFSFINLKGGEIVSQDGRYRDFCFVGYPESFPIDWIDRLNKFNLEWAFCLHNRDCDDNGEVKKEHVHGIIHFDGKKSKEQVSAIFIMSGVAPGIAGYKDGTSNINLVVPCHNKRGSVRYLIHYDDKDKFQYQKSDIRVFGGFDIEKYFDYSSSEQQD